MPPDTFLTVNVDPHLLDDPRVAEVLTGEADLMRLVLELTEHTQAESRSTAASVLTRVREAGGMVAMDDAGTGYAGLSQLLELRPHIVKLDRELITGIDGDRVRAALVEVFGDLAGRMDTGVLAEGIETEAELAGTRHDRHRRPDARAVHSKFRGHGSIAQTTTRPARPRRPWPRRGSAGAGGPGPSRDDCRRRLTSRDGSPATRPGRHRRCRPGPRGPELVPAQSSGS